MNSEAWILTKVQWVLYQWICLDKLYKLMKSCFQISESLFELTTIFQNNSGVGFLHVWRGRHLCSSARVLVYTFIGASSWMNCHFLLCHLIQIDPLPLDSIFAVFEKTVSHRGLTAMCDAHNTWFWLHVLCLKFSYEGHVC